MQEDILKKQLLKKTKKLAELEKKLGFNGEIETSSDFKISRKIYACFDGFIIFRTFSKVYQEPFLHISTNQRIDIFKKSIPIRTTNGQFFSLYELLKSSIGLEFRLGTKLDIGSQGGGISIGDSIKVDGFQLSVHNYSEMAEITETLEDLKFTMEMSEKLNKLEFENILLNQTIFKIENLKTPKIITEGKTDWKYFISALRFFHKKGEFKDIQENWFLKFGSGDDVSKKSCDTDFELINNVSNLNILLDSFIKSRELVSKDYNSTIIGVFDSDDKNARERKDINNKIYSFLIEPSGISTELLFGISELTFLVDNKRLFIGTEFDEKSKQLKSDRTINLGGDNNTLNKAGKNVIIDANVFNSNGDNIALSKEIFSQNIYNNKIKISDNSWENFRHVFIKINDFIRK